MTCSVLLFHHYPYGPHRPHVAYDLHQTLWAQRWHHATASTSNMSEPTHSFKAMARKILERPFGVPELLRLNTLNTQRAYHFGYLQCEP